MSNECQATAPKDEGHQQARQAHLGTKGILTRSGRCSVRKCSLHKHEGLGISPRSPVFRTVGLRHVLAPKQQSPGEPLAQSSGNQKDQGVMRANSLFLSLLAQPPPTHPRAGPWPFPAFHFFSSVQVTLESTHLLILLPRRVPPAPIHHTSCSHARRVPDAPMHHTSCSHARTVPPAPTHSASRSHARYL